MKNAVAWSASPCSRVDVDSSVLETDVIRPSETSVNIYQTAGRHIPQDFFLHSSRRENLTSQNIYD
jgi:hypothetical protein